MTQQRFMDIRIVFEKTTEDDYVYYRPIRSSQLATNIHESDLYDVAETWAQTDHYQLLSSDVIVSALSNEETDLTR